jgi:hypothetical protein
MTIHPSNHLFHNHNRAFSHSKRYLSHLLATNMHSISMHGSVDIIRGRQANPLISNPFSSFSVSYAYASISDKVGLCLSHGDSETGKLHSTQIQVETNSIESQFSSQTVTAHPSDHLHLSEIDTLQFYCAFHRQESTHEVCMSIDAISQSKKRIFYTFNGLACVVCMSACLDSACCMLQVLFCIHRKSL